MLTIGVAATIRSNGLKSIIPSINIATTYGGLTSISGYITLESTTYIGSHYINVRTLI